MPTEELNIRISADSKDLDKGLDDASKKVDKFGKKTEETGKKLDDMTKKAEKGSTTISKAMSALLTGITAAATAIGIAGVKFNSSIETYQTSFEVMTGSAEKAVSIITRLKDIAASTPFGLEGLAETTQLLMNYGIEGDTAIEMMTRLGDIAQGDSEKLNSIALAFGQMSSLGKVTLQDVKQMISAGFNPLQEISESTGESMESLYDRISDGTMSVDEITAAMVRSTSAGGKYFQSMEKQSKTLSGQWSTLKDTFAEASGKVMKGITDWLSARALPKAIQVVQALGDNFEQLVPAIVSVTAAVAGMKIAMNFTNIITSIQQVMAALTATSGVVGILIASISLMIGAFASAAIEAQQTSEEYKAFEAEIGKVDSALQTLQETHANNDLALQTSITSYEGVSKQAEDYVARLEELQGKTELTTAEQEEWKNLCSGLVQIMPELNSLINTETGEIQGGTQALRDNIEQWKEKAYAEALTQRLTQLYQEQIEAENLLTEAEGKLLEAQSNLSEAQRTGNDLVSQANTITGQHSVTVEGARAALAKYAEANGDADGSIQALIDSLNANISAQSEATQEMDIASASCETARTSYNDVTTSIDDCKNRMGLFQTTAETTAQVTEQTSSDMASSAESAGQSIGGSFKSAGDRSLQSIRNLRDNGAREFDQIGTKFKTSGMNAVFGAKYGIESKQGSLVDAARKLAQMVNNAFRVKLKIHSPSKVMAESGKFVVEGIIVGMKEQFGIAKNMVSNFATDLETSFSPNLTIPDVSFKINPVTSNFVFNDWMSNLNNRKSNQNIVLEVDGKVLAETTCESINNLTAQTGTIPLRAF